MTDFHKIKLRVDEYEDHLACINAMFESEGNTKRVQLEGEDLNGEFSSLVEDVSSAFYYLIREFAKAGIDIRDIDVHDGGRNEPYHSIFMKIGHSQKTFMGGCASKHFKVDGFPYHPKLKE